MLALEAHILFTNNKTTHLKDSGRTRDADANRKENVLSTKRHSEIASKYLKTYSSTART